MTDKTQSFLHCPNPLVQMDRRNYMAVILGMSLDELLAKLELIQHTAEGMSNPVIADEARMATDITLAYGRFIYGATFDEEHKKRFPAAKEN